MAELIPERKKYTIWLETESWTPYDFDTLQECFDHMRGFGHSGAYRITRDVDFEIREKVTITAPLPGMGGITGIAGPFNA